MRMRPGAETRIHAHRVCAFYLVHVDHFRTVADGQVHSLPSGGTEPLDRAGRNLADIKAFQHRGGELHHAKAKREVRRVSFAADISVPLQGLEQPQHRRLVHAQLFRQRSEPFAPSTQLIEQLKGTFEALRH